MRAQDPAVGVALIDHDVAQRSQEARPPLVARQEGEVQEVGVGQDDVGVGAGPVALGQGGVAVAGAGAHGADRPGLQAGLPLDGLDLGRESLQECRLVGGQGLGGGEVQRGRAAAVGGDTGAPGGADAGPAVRPGILGGQDAGQGRQPRGQGLAGTRPGGEHGVTAGVDGVGGRDLMRPRGPDPEAPVGGHEHGIGPGGPLAMTAGAGRGALKMDEPAVARADARQELGEVARGPVGHGTSVPQG